MKLHETILEDYLWHAYRLKDPRILKALKRTLSAREQGGFKLHATVISGKKLVAVVEYPERVKEVILITKRDPRKVYRFALTLKRKQNAAKA